jgi:hypothetical protein
LYTEDDAEEAAALIREYLGDEEARLRIAAAGREKAAALHSAEARARQLAAHLLEMPKHKPRRCFLGAAIAHLNAVLNGSLRQKLGSKNSQVQTKYLVHMDCVCDALVESLERDEPADSDTEISVLNSAVYGRAIGHPEYGLRAAHAAHKSLPENKLLLLNYLENLVSNGLSENAYSYARTVSDTPDALVDTAVRAIRDAHASVLKIIDEHQLGPSMLVPERI